MNLSHFMIDLETMGLRPTSAVVSIGVVHFDAERIIDKFYTPVSLADCRELGMTTDASTEAWWARQSVEARSAWQVEDAPKVIDALTELNRWIANYALVKKVAPWGNGADFDIPLIKNMYEAVNAEPPWMYYNQHCYRTLKNMFPVAAMPRAGVYHNAVDDAVYQVQHLQQILKVHKWNLS